MRLLALKLLLTAGVCGLIGWSLTKPDQGFLAELQMLGPWGTVALVAGFVLAVAGYARDLQRLLEAVPDRFRAARPKSVWLMFLLPYNFVEDFWIMGNIAVSLKAHAAARGATGGTFGMISGLGWCALQILALVPHEVGSVAGLLAVPLWLWHWAYVRRARAAMMAGA